MQIPGGLCELVDATWQFQNNWGWKDVKLHHPSKTAMLDVSQMFKSMEGQTLKPPIRQAKLDSEVGPGDSASQVAPSTASSKASMQPTAAPVLDNTPSKLNPAKRHRRNAGCQRRHLGQGWLPWPRALQQCETHVSLQ